MNKICYILFLLVFISCERVIDVDLNEANPAIVIEGNLSYDKGELLVSISKTTSFFGDDEMKTISNAQVNFKYQNGELININETSPGIYEGEQLLLQPENLYGLIVELDGKDYEAESFLHRPVAIDSLANTYFNGNGFFDGGYRIKLYFSDPPVTENYYRIKVYKNNVLQNDVNDLIVFDDSGINGKTIEVTLRGQSFEENDTARVEMITIDKNVFEYYSSLRDLINLNPGSPAPANPVSNFSNGALGYFSVWSSDSKEILIKKR